ncbi:ABC transporter substrate-binding protein [Pseudactinotalea terrae]|uniref:ABC transporter substrate-binding protein n=1 Tax=Pseudactinotalea terrae TaxID=1743262 RepID=UPI001390D91E|nr:extracellular solute-binding protein [Pseudactinotalea terrae]
MTTYVTRRGFITLVGSGAAVAAVAGCRPGTDGTAGDQAGGGAATSDVELRLMVWASAAEAERYEEDLAVFTDKTGIGVKLEFLDVGGYQDKLNTLFAAGDPPDVMFQVGRWIGEYATRGVLAELDQFSDVIDLDAVDAGLLEQATYQGKLYGVPTGSTTIAYVYDRELVTGLGLEMPDDTTWTWADFAAFNAAIYEASDGQTYGTGFYVPWLPTITQWARQHGQDLFTSDGTVGTDAATIGEYFQLIEDMRADGGFAAQGVLEDDSAASLEQSLLGRGVIASQIIPANQFSDLNSALDGRLQLMRVPGEVDGARRGYTVTPTLLWCQAAESEHPQEAAQLIDFLTNDPESYGARSIFLGVPANAEVAEVVAAEVSENEQAFVDFTLGVQSEDLPAYDMEPAGTGEVQNILVTLATEVEYQRMTPQQAGEEFMSQAAAALEAAG